MKAGFNELNLRKLVKRDVQDKELKIQKMVRDQLSKLFFLQKKLLNLEAALNVLSSSIFGCLAADI